MKKIMWLVGGIIGAWLSFRVLGFTLGLLITILPIAGLGAGAYFGWRYLIKRLENSQYVETGRRLR